MYTTTTMFIPLVAFALGYCLTQINGCLVAAVNRLLVHRKLDWLLGLLFAASSSAVLLLFISKAEISLFSMPSHVSIDASLAAGGVLLGLGALVNGACMLGSIAEIGKGNYHFTFTLLGVLIAMLLFPLSLSIGPIEIFQTHAKDTNGIKNHVFFGLFAIAFIWGLVKLIYQQKYQMFFLLGAGVFGGLLFSANPTWSYTSVLGKLICTRSVCEFSEQDVSAIMVFLGAMLGMYLKNVFCARFSFRLAIRNFLGGILMGFGAIMIPGGNDSLLLWAMPGNAIYGVAALFIAVVTIAIGVFLERNYKLLTMEKSND